MNTTMKKDDRVKFSDRWFENKSYDEKHLNEAKSKRGTVLHVGRKLMKVIWDGNKSFMTYHQIFIEPAEDKAILDYADALHMARKILGWDVPHVDDFAVFQTRQLFHTVLYYRQTNISADKWKRLFDFLEYQRYKLPLVMIDEEQLRKMDDGK